MELHAACTFNCLLYLQQLGILIVLTGPGAHPASCSVATGNVCRE